MLLCSCTVLFVLLLTMSFLFSRATKARYQGRFAGQVQVDPVVSLPRHELSGYGSSPDFREISCIPGQERSRFLNMRD